MRLTAYRLRFHTHVHTNGS